MSSGSKSRISLCSWDYQKVDDIHSQGSKREKHHVGSKGVQVPFRDRGDEEDPATETGSSP